MGHPVTTDEERRAATAPADVRVLDGLPVPLRWAVISAAVFSVVGGAAGLVVGLFANPATAWFAVLELGVPTGFIGVWIGLLAGGIASLISGHDRNRAPRRRDEHRSSDILSGVVVTLGALAVLSALRWMDWASHEDQVNRTTFTNGPTRLLAIAALSSIILAVSVAIARWSWLRLLLLTATLLIAGTAVAVALSGIASANSIQSTGQGPSTSSYESGAVVGVVAAFVMVAAATLGHIMSLAHRMLWSATADRRTQPPRHSAI